MTQEEKQLLLKDLCARLSYGVILDNPNPCGEHWDELISIDVSKGTVTLLYDGRTYKVEKIKPYLRPMSSMTEDEFEQMVTNSGIKDVEFVSVRTCKERMEFYFKTVACDIRNIDWLNAHHFDYRGLIEKGIALKAPDDMYN